MTIWRRRKAGRSNFCLVAALLLCSEAAVAQNIDRNVTHFRAPAYPLITHDPYFSVWSFSDRLTDSDTRHWTGARHSLAGLIRIDGKPYRWMGEYPKETSALEQTSVEIQPTRTIYHFQGFGITLDVTFLSPVLPSDLDLMSRPVSYLAWTVKATDGRSHQVQLLLQASGNLAVTTGKEQLVWSRLQRPRLKMMRIGSYDQPVLQKSGDNLRIDWGYFYLVVPEQAGESDAEGSGSDLAKQFAETGNLPYADDMRQPRQQSDQDPALAAVISVEVGSQPVERHVLLAYDDIAAIEFMGRPEPAYWRHTGKDFGQLLETVEHDYPSINARAEAFDRELLNDLKQVGGDAYARLASLAFRQTIAAHKLVYDFDGSLMLFSKENFSNGCIDTVDVTYPSSPFFLLFNSTLLKAQLTPILEYAESPRWRFPFAPHDLGTYPKANGQVYGGGERTEDDQMPVEESGNVLIMIAALAKVEGNGNFAVRHWDTLEKWASYLKEKGMDPANQLSTDDFAGHLAHNANLSLKAILALGGFSQIAERTGHHTVAVEYSQLTHDMASQWVQKARSGDHYSLAFDKPDSWSQKYNLVWDRILGLNLFPDSVAQTEIAFYKRTLGAYGLALDNRQPYTKLDWEVWTATLTSNPQDFQTLLAPIDQWLAKTPSRVPLTDWYWIGDGKQAGFQARSVVGGVYIPFLRNAKLWEKWAQRAQAPPASEGASNTH